MEGWTPKSAFAAWALTGTLCFALDRADRHSAANAPRGTARKPGLKKLTR